MFVSFRDFHSILKNSLLVQASVLCALTTTACKDESLVPVERIMSGVYNYGTVDARFCLSTPTPAHQKLKYLFVVDHSASNKPGVTIDLTDVQNTDPTGGRRYGPMINFVKNLNPDPNTSTSFGIIDFNDTATQPTGLNGFEPDLTTFVNIATTDWIGGGTANSPSPADSGFTNYQAALSLAQQVIAKDAQAESVLQSKPIVSVVYQIVFVSDGAPTILATGGSTLYTQQFTADLQPVISKIMDLKNNPTLSPFIAGISLNTAYYFNTAQAPNANAVTLLQQMANAGSGLFIQFASGQQILYQQFAPPSRNVLNELADVFVENENGVWWDNGQFMLDSDGDGLPDLIEQQFGSNPNLKDSDGNGVSDLVEYRTKGHPCNSATCAPSGRDTYAICAGFSPTKDASGNVSFASSANDGLNDCEKYLLSGNPQSFNSNGDLIPDFFSLKNTIPIQPGNSNVALADPFGDGITNYDKVKLGLPIQVSNKQLSAFDARTSTLVTESSTGGINCYHLTVENVALASPQDKIKVYVVQNNSLIQNKAFLMTAEKTMNDQGRTANFVAGDFK